MFTTVLLTCLNRTLLHYAATLLLHGGSVDLVSVSHMGVLLAPLLKGLTTAHNRTMKRLFSSMNPYVVLEGAHRLALSTTVLTPELTLARTLILRHSTSREASVARFL